MSTIAKLAQYWSIFLLVFNFAISCLWIGLKQKWEEIKLAVAMLKEFKK